MIESICSDKTIDIVLYLQSIKSYLLIIIILLSLFLIIHFFIKLKMYKKEHTLWKKAFKALLLILLMILFLFGISLAKSNLISSDLCLESEEKLSVEKSSLDIKKAKDIKIKKSQEVLRDNNFYFLNVGAGTEAFIIEDHGHFGLIDTSYNSKASYILKELELLGAKELDFLIITHSHLDHMGGYDKIMSNIKVNVLYIKVPGNVNSDYVETYNHMINLAEEKKTIICNVKEPLCQNIDLENIEIKLYNTDFFSANDILGLDRSRIENANSIVAVASINNRKIYFSSDIGNYYEHDVEISLSKEIGDIDVYKVSHHGFTSYNNNSLALSNLKPEYGIVTNTKILSRNAVTLLKETNPNYQKTYYTTEGTVTLHVESDGTLIFNQ